jgi:hypothetical protein
MSKSVRWIPRLQITHRSSARHIIRLGGSPTPVQLVYTLTRPLCIGLTGLWVGGWSIAVQRVYTLSRPLWMGVEATVAGWCRRRERPCRCRRRGSLLTAPWRQRWTPGWRTMPHFRFVRRTQTPQLRLYGLRRGRIRIPAELESLIGLPACPELALHAVGLTVPCTRTAPRILTPR